MLLDHELEQVAGVGAQRGVATAGTAPGEFLPNDEAKFVAEIKHQLRLLIVGETDEVRAHVADHAQLAAGNVVGDGGGGPSVIFVTMRAAQEKLFSVEEESAVLLKFEMAQPEALRAGLLSELAA
jgi:hypothetical protein